MASFFPLKKRKEPDGREPENMGAARKQQKLNESEGNSSEVPGSSDSPAPPDFVSQLDTLLKKYKEGLTEAGTKLCYSSQEVRKLEQVQTLKETLEQHGFVILCDAISKKSIEQAKCKIGQCICDLWSETLQEEPEIRERLKNGDLYCFQRFRNASSGQGNASFGYYYLQYLQDTEYPKINIEGDEISLDHNPIHAKVNLDLISHEDNKHSLAIMLALTHINGMISWDSVKFSTNPRPKPKTMTKQAMTPMHIDYYGDEIHRYQAIDNEDAVTKLFFVPGTHSEEAHELLSKIAGKALFTSHGYKRIPSGSNEKLTKVLWKHAIAPPPYSRVIWKSGTIHFEGEASKRPLPPDDPFAGAYSCCGLKDSPNAQRLRFVIGNHIPTINQESLMKLGIAAERGLCPAVYGKVNKQTCVHPNIVNRKTTQYKIPRKISEAKLQYLHDKVKEISSTENPEPSKLKDLAEKEISSPLKRLLYGIQQPIESLGFSEDDTQILRALMPADKE